MMALLSKFSFLTGITDFFVDVTLKSNDFKMFLRFFFTLNVENWNLQKTVLTEKWIGKKIIRIFIVVRKKSWEIEM